MGNDPKIRILVTVGAVVILTLIETLAGGHAFVLIFLSGAADFRDLSVKDLLEELQYVCAYSIMPCFVAILVKVSVLAVLLSRKRPDAAVLLRCLLGLGALNFLISGLVIVRRFLA